MPPENHLEEASLSNPKGRDIFSWHSCFNTYFDKFVIIWQICFLLNRSLLGDNNIKLGVLKEQILPRFQLPPAYPVSRTTWVLFNSNNGREWDKIVTCSLSSSNFVPKLKTLNIKSPPPNLLPILLVPSKLTHPFLIKSSSLAFLSRCTLP